MGCRSGGVHALGVDPPSVDPGNQVFIPNGQNESPETGTGLVHLLRRCFCSYGRLQPVHREYVLQGLKTVCRTAMVLLVLSALPLTLAGSGALAQSGDKKPDFSQFYRAPDLDMVPSYIRQADTSGAIDQKGQRAALIGFMAALFAGHGCLLPGCCRPRARGLMGKGVPAPSDL